MRVALLFECYGAVICFVVLHAHSWPVVLSLPFKVNGLETRYLVTFVVLVAAFPCALLQPRHLSVFGPLGLLATTVLFAAAIATPLISPVSEESFNFDDGHSSTGHNPTIVHEVLNPAGIGMAIGIILFCFAGHATFPDLYHQLPAKEWPHFDRAANRGFAIAGVLYGIFASIGYRAYGNCAAAALTLNLMQQNPILGRIAAVAVLISTFTIIPIQFYVVMRIIENSSPLLRAAESKPGGFLNVTEGSRWIPVTPSCSQLLQPITPFNFAVRLFLFWAVGFIALAIPNFHVVVALIGAFHYYDYQLHCAADFAYARLFQGWGKLPKAHFTVLFATCLHGLCWHVCWRPERFGRIGIQDAS